MPEDLAQQIPYIRRALEAYRIPILELAGFEADDVIGTLARKAAAASYPVYVVSSDKDMMQLVNDDVLILNPPKDNLICDAAKVEEILGVPPERVIDVMALRGDSIDNIPGAPGIGDKGSVEIIKRFGTVEQALDRAAEVEKKTYRESLQNNRDIILFSKSMATIDTNVPVELERRSHARRRARSRSPPPALHRTRIHLAAERIAAGSPGHRSSLQRSRIRRGCRRCSRTLCAQEGALAIAVELDRQNRFQKPKKKWSKKNRRSGMLALTDDSSPRTVRPNQPPAASPSPQPQARPPSSNWIPAAQPQNYAPS